MQLYQDKEVDKMNLWPWSFAPHEGTLFVVSTSHSRFCRLLTTCVLSSHELRTIHMAGQMTSRDDRRKAQLLNFCLLASSPSL